MIRGNQSYLHRWGPTWAAVAVLVLLAGLIAFMHSRAEPAETFTYHQQLEARAGLDRIIPSLTLRNAGLRAALAELSRASGVPIDVDDSVFPDFPEAPGPVNCELRNVSLRTAIDVVLIDSDHGTSNAQWQLNNSRILVSTRQHTGKERTRIYDTRRLIAHAEAFERTIPAGPSNSGYWLPSTPRKDLQHLLLQSVDAGEWVGDRFVLTASDQIHHQVSRTLAALDHTRTAPAVAVNEDVMIDLARKLTPLRRPAILDRKLRAESVFGVTVQDALDALARSENITVKVRWIELEAQGIEPTARISLVHGPITLEEKLRMLLWALDHEDSADAFGWPETPTFFVRDDAIVFTVTPPGATLRATLTRIYDVRDILQAASEWHSQIAARAGTKLDSWPDQVVWFGSNCRHRMVGDRLDDFGVTWSYFGGHILISDRYARHALIERHFTNIRRAIAREERAP